jgi:hypothetical protein
MRQLIEQNNFLEKLTTLILYNIASSCFGTRIVPPSWQAQVGYVLSRPTVSPLACAAGQIM